MKFESIWIDFIRSNESDVLPKSTNTTKRILFRFLRRKSHLLVPFVRSSSNQNYNLRITTLANMRFVSVQIVLSNIAIRRKPKGNPMIICESLTFQEKKFKCDRCSKAFGTNANLTRHHLSHSVRIGLQSLESKLWKAAVHQTADSTTMKFTRFNPIFRSTRRGRFNASFAQKFSNMRNFLEYTSGILMRFVSSQGSF